MSRIYVDRISPYQSGSITIDGYQAEINTGSFATTGSNTFIGNQDVQGIVSQDVNYSTVGLQTLTALSNVSGTDGSTYTSGFAGWLNNGQKLFNGYNIVFSTPGQFSTSHTFNPEYVQYKIQPSGSATTSEISLVHDGDTSTTAKVNADDFVISGSVDVSGSFKFNQPYPAAFGTTVLEQYSPLTLTNGAAYGDVVRQQSNVQAALNGKINGFLTSFRQNKVGVSNWYAQEWIGPRYLAWEMRPSGSAAESTIQLFNADNAGTDVTAKITADVVDINGPVTLDQTLKLEPQDPLPAGELGQLAVSGSALYFNDGSTWNQIS